MYFSYLCRKQGAMCRPSHCSPQCPQVQRSCLHTFPTFTNIRLNNLHTYLHVWNWRIKTANNNTSNSPCSFSHSRQTLNPSEAAVLMLMCWEEQSNEQLILNWRQQFVKGSYPEWVPFELPFDAWAWGMPGKFGIIRVPTLLCKYGFQNLICFFSSHLYRK